MKKLFAGVLFFCVPLLHGSALPAQAKGAQSVRVGTYVRKNGTVVHSHMRSATGSKGVFHSSRRSGPSFSKSFIGSPDPFRSNKSGVAGNTGFIRTGKSVAGVAPPHDVLQGRKNSSGTAVAGHVGQVTPNATQPVWLNPRVKIEPDYDRADLDPFYAEMKVVEGVRLAD